jgi:hypothetical protein
MSLAPLLAAKESVWFDRKRLFHANRIELLHDILCLANAYHDGDRYLIFGQADDLTVTGVSQDENRLTNAALHDFLRQSSLNRIPTLELLFESENNLDLGVIHIVNRPDKPFFVTTDRSHQGKTLRAGVIYTRLGDTNIPMGTSAPEDQIELMWRERFGLGLTPFARFQRLLDSAADWVEIRGEDYRYHRQFSEFTIRNGKDINLQFNETWTKKFPDPNASSYYKEVYYNGTLIERMVFVSCDGGRYQIPLPERDDNGRFIIARNSTAMRLALQLWQYLPLEEAIARAGIELV